MTLKQRQPGILLYIVAAVLGWFVHPLVAVAIFVLVVSYYACTSQGINSLRYAED